MSKPQSRDHCNISVKAIWPNGDSVDFKIDKLRPDTMADLIQWLRARRVTKG